MNAKKELMEAIGLVGYEIICAEIFVEHWVTGENKVITLPLDYSDSEYRLFFNLLDFNYNNLSEVQLFSGFVWLEHDWWLERIDDSFGKYWKANRFPSIPSGCKREKI